MNAIAILITFFAWACAFYVKGAVWSTLATILMNVLAFGLLIVGGIAYVFGTERGNGGFVVYKASGCDGLIAVGGGSAIDCAKGVAIAATHDEPLTKIGRASCRERV